MKPTDAELIRAAFKARTAMMKVALGAVLE